MIIASTFLVVVIILWLVLGNLLLIHTRLP